MKKVWVNIAVGIFFILLAVMIFYFVLYLSALMHEKAHVREAYRQGIAFNYYVNIFDLTKWDNIGGAYPVNETECERFNMLPASAQSTIRYAGVKQEIVVLFPLYIFSFILTVQFWVKHVRHHPYKAVLLCSLTLVFLLVMVISILGNIYLPPCALNNWHLNDWYAGNFNCSSFG